MKTATTYVQYILEQNRSELNSLGWTYPGLLPNQQLAFYGLCGGHIPWVTKAATRRYAELGSNLSEALYKRSQHAIVSCEALASLTEAGIKNLLTKIPTPDLVVFTLRPLSATLKSGWQQYLKRGTGISLDEFILNAIDQQDTENPQEIPLMHLYGDSVRRWKNVVQCPIHLADIPSSLDPDMTWQVFRAATKMPELSDRAVPRLNSNYSLSRDAAELLRRFNATFIDTEVLCRRRQKEFVNNCLLAEPYISLGSEKIEIDPVVMKHLQDVDAKQRTVALQHADLLFSSTALEGMSYD